MKRLASILRGFACFAVFAAVFGTVCHFIHEALPFPDVPIVRQKLQQFTARPDDFDTIFIGSSRIHYQIIPPVFDELATTAGLPTSSYNAGVAGMRPVEDSFLLDRLLENPPKNLRWVFIELAGMRLAIDAEKRETLRALYWHDWPRLSLLFQRATVLKPVKSGKRRKLRQTIEELSEPMGDFLNHLALFARNQTNFGRGTALTSRMLTGISARRSPAADAPADPRAGWIPTGRPEEMAGAQLESYERALAERRAAPPRKDFGDPISQKALERMIAKIEKLGATAVLIVPPTTAKKNFYPVPERERKTIVLDFSDIARFPELYENANRLDTDHVNTAGSDVFTRVLVRRWAEEVKARR